MVSLGSDADQENASGHRDRDERLVNKKGRGRHCEFVPRSEHPQRLHVRFEDGLGFLPLLLVHIEKVSKKRTAVNVIILEMGRPTKDSAVMVS